MRYLILIAALMSTAACAAEPGASTQVERSISVSGLGEIEVIPDAAYVSMGIEARHQDLQKARDEVDKTVQTFLALTDKLDIDRKYVTTAGMNVRPEYRWEDKTRKRYLDAYVVTRQLQVDLRDLDKLGALMTRAVQAGVNQVNPPQFRATKERDLQRQALARAAADARANAEALANSLDVKLGELLRLDAQHQRHNPMPMPRVAMRMEAAADMSGAEQSYETGQIRYSAQVSASFELR
ncbi:MAG: SIMPL domain-containing protein [Nevskiales bacterium]